MYPAVPYACTWQGIAHATAQQQQRSTFIRADVCSRLLTWFVAAFECRSGVCYSRRCAPGLSPLWVRHAAAQVEDSLHRNFLQEDGV